MTARFVGLVAFSPSQLSLDCAWNSLSRPLSPSDSEPSRKIGGLSDRVSRRMSARGRVASRSRTFMQAMPVCLVYEYCFLREHFYSTGRDLVGTRLHVNRCLPHLLNLHYPVVRLTHFRVGQDHNPVRQVLFKLHRPLHRRSHSPQLRCHQTGRTGLYESVDKIQNRSPPLNHLRVLEDQRGHGINNNPLRVDQLGMSLDPLDKAQDRKVLPTDRRPADLHLTWHMPQR